MLDVMDKTKKHATQTVNRAQQLQSSSMVLNKGWFCPQGTSDNAAKYCGVHTCEGEVGIRGVMALLPLAPSAQWPEMLVNTLPCAGKSSTAKNYLFQNVSGAMLEKINKWFNKPDILETSQYPSSISPFSLSQVSLGILLYILLYLL